MSTHDPDITGKTDLCFRMIWHLCRFGLSQVRAGVCLLASDGLARWSSVSMAISVLGLHAGTYLGPLRMKSTAFQIGSREDTLSRRADMTMRDPKSSAVMPSPSRFWPEYKNDHGKISSCRLERILIRGRG
jgi:hypothetical protein